MDPIREYRELEFRGGVRSVPDYLADMMTGMKTHRMTYDEAIAEANRLHLSDYLNAKQDDVVAAHFRRGPR